MAPAPPTVVSLKQTFLTTQTRQLSQPLTPTRAWHSTNTTTTNTNNTTEDQPLPEKAVADALFKLNHRLRQHARRVYAPQATRHVAEQIDQLYWNAAEAATTHDHDNDSDAEAAAEALTLGADLGTCPSPISITVHFSPDRKCVCVADPAVIASLPLAWDDSDSDSAETQRYAALAGDLHALAERKQAAAARVARLRRMRALLEPFAAASSSLAGDDDNAGGGVQENLVTRNGEVEAELQRMRMLLARVGGRAGMLREQGAGRESSVGSLFSDRGEGVDERRKVEELLDRF